MSTLFIFGWTTSKPKFFSHKEAQKLKNRRTPFELLCFFVAKTLSRQGPNSTET
jgi:hypothetical protein